LKTETGEIISKKEALVREAMECGFQRFEAEAFYNCLRRFQQHEREACAKVAEKSWQEFRDTKDAHERLSPAPFKLENFGFNHSTIQQSQIIANNIRARGQA
jgi:hypothetical protein